MGYHVIKPPQHLANYVRCFWILEGDIPYQHHALADGLAEMVFHYHGTFNEIVDNREELSWRSGVQAQSQYARRFVTHSAFGIFGVHLYPYTLTTLFNIPPEAMSGEMPDLYSLLGHEGTLLEEQVMVASDHQARVEILSRFIERKLRQCNSPLSKMSIAVKQTLERRGQISVKEMAAEYGVSVRQFERSFKQFAGFSPKLYTRIVRFSNAVHTYKNAPTTLTDLAYTFGYYDQAHFIEDFKTFSGVSPRQYFTSIKHD
ncbi:helix-turn-helix domain-containing protein [Pseudochryseolinea flava]|uniref:AraC family transcriptional regulator n=1 Tax=Pseudochryseolinea flava TaxID=2059302 RepID=A0A364Y7B6_9BACT|nr:helix-turn-helix transcriptional regulator [Pseudochryseolinea flava]RAW03006.1 AraC family transcriptional regulator [Pseudochryseolinea flava]